MALSIEERRELNRLEQESLDLESRGLTLENEKLSRLRELRTLRGEELRDQESSVEYQAQILGQLNERIKKAKIIQQQGVEVTGIYRDQLSVAEKLLDTQEKELDVNDANYKTDLARIAAARDELAIKRKGYNDAEGFAKRFAGITKEPTSEFGKLLVGGGARLEGLAEGLADVISPTAILGSTVDKVVEATVALAMEQDQAVVNFRRATGASGEFDDNIRGLERSLFTAGVSATEAGQSVQTLFLNVTDFTEMSETQQRTLGETVAVLNELGVASETVANNIQFATKAMGMSTDQAAELQRELFTFAQDLGVSAGKIAEDFQSMGPQIAAMGANGVDAFRKLETAAKNTGLQMSELLGVVEKFDRFDTAAEAVGRLNALLGGPFLNSVELVSETDLGERFKILKNRIDQAGLSFDQMDYYQRKALASAMGLNEQQLALMMRGRLDLIQEPAKSAEEIEQLAEQTAQFNTIMQELKQVAMGLAISFGPFISILKTGIELLSFLAPFIQGALIPAIASLAIAVGKLTMAQAALFAPVFVAFQAYSMLTDMFGLGKPAAIGLSVALGVLTYAMYAFGTATNVALFGIPALLGGLSMLAVGVYEGFSPSVLMALGALTFAFFALAPAILPLMPLIGAVTLAIAGLATAAMLISKVFGEAISDQFVTNLQLMSVEIANIIDKINELDTAKAVTFTATTAVVAASTAVTGVASAAMAAVGLNAPAAPAAAPEGATGTAGAAPTINISLNVDGKDMATVVNSVEVSKYTGGQRSALYDSIVEAFTNNLTTG